MNSRLEVLKCPSCGADIDFLLGNNSDCKCEYCGSVIHFNREPEPTTTVHITDGFGTVTPEQAITRVTHLFYLGKYEQAREVLEKVLIYYPSNKKLLELENQCECFLTRNFGNFIKMLSARTFLVDEESARYITEIESFCTMVGSNAINSLNTPMLRKQNVENYEAILDYIANLKKCLSNNAVIHCDKLYEVVRRAILKLSAIVCNTLYIKNTRLPRQYVMLIDINYRRQLKADFDAINLLGETEYEIVDEGIVIRYLSGGIV